ncbi:hypothetical protein JEQ12_004065 [Ovis aries]|uniref:Ankyrin repeat domain-containing protein 26-like n=1 Tax=Ovis aries TaxID=9940 RepID=A0A836CW78_SHEEP|nr:hypothetical protein JEQ12_004065 [Ovis aries]
MLNSKLENEKESKRRLEMEVESYRSRLAAASHDHHQCQTSERDLELAFQRARDEWLHLQDKMKTEVANLKDNNEMLSQQLSRAEKLEMENAELQTTVKKQEGKNEQLQKNLSSTRSIDDLTAELETTSSKCLHLDAKNHVLREELLSMKGMQKKCEKLEKNKKKLEQEAVNLRSHIEMNMIERSQVEQYKRETEERARQDLVEKLKEVNLFCRTHEKLAVISTKLEVEKEQNKSLLSTLSTRSVLEPSCVGNFNNPLVPNGNLTPRANIGFPTSIPYPLNNSMETYLTKIANEKCESMSSHSEKYSSSSFIHHVP